MGVTDHRVVRPRRPVSVSLTAAVLALAAPATAGAELADREPRGSAGPTGPEPAPGAVRAVAGEHTVATDDGLYRVAPSLGEAGAHPRPGHYGRRSRRGQRSRRRRHRLCRRRARAPARVRDRLLPARSSTRTSPGPPTGSRRRRSRIRQRDRAHERGPQLGVDRQRRGRAPTTRCSATNPARCGSTGSPSRARASPTSSRRPAAKPGFAAEHASHLIFVDGSLGASCGIASYEGDDRLSLDNRSNAGGGYRRRLRALLGEPRRRCTRART